MRRLLGVLALLALAGCAEARPEPAPAVPAGPTVRLVTWNVHNLFDPVDDPYQDEVPSEAEYRAKLEALGRVLRPLEADLVALQEVENERVVRDLALVAGRGYQHLAFQEGNDQGRGIDVALVSRVPLAGFRSHASEVLPSVPGAPRGYRFSRDCLEVHVALPEPVVVLVNHFKSRAGNDPAGDAKRRSQALGVERILASLGSTPTAVVGDLNDRPDTWSLAPLLQDGLVDVLGGLAERERATYVYGGRPIALDYILVNEGLAPRVVAARVVRGDEVRAASDHSPVLAEFLAGGPAAGAGEPAR